MLLLLLILEAFVEQAALAPERGRAEVERPKWREVVLMAAVGFGKEVCIWMDGWRQNGPSAPSRAHVIVHLSN